MGLQPYVFAFADNGNITAKTDAGGKYIYHPTKINAVQYIKDYTSAIPPLQQDITYTPFLRPLKITEGVNELEYTYASDYERRKGVLRKSGAVENTRLYLGDYEINTDKNGVKTFVHYLSGGEAIVVKRDNAAFEYYFPYTDHLGSIVAVTSTVGTVVAEQNFDAWGRKRNPTNWTYDNVPSVPAWLYRGYTGHEHLAEFNLINMNARLYDPVLGRMLSPDNFIQGGTQGFNRYSYANNNPFKFTDPSGNYIHLIVGAVLGAINGWQIGAANGATGFKLFGYIAAGAGIGALSAGVGQTVTAAVGKGVSGAYGGLVGTAVGGAAGGAINGGGFAALSGQNALLGALKGAASGIVSSVSGGYIGGSEGAFVGGGLGGATSALLNGGDLGDIGSSFALGGLTSTIVYDISMDIAYKKYRMENRGISREQFEVMSTSAQKSFVRGKEYGGWLLKNGGVEMWETGEDKKIKIKFPMPTDAVGDFHTHPNWGVDAKTGLTWQERHSPDDLKGFLIKRNYPHMDMFFKSIVVGRQNTYLYSPASPTFLGTSIFFSSSAFTPYRYIYPFSLK